MFELMAVGCAAIAAFLAAGPPHARDRLTRILPAHRPRYPSAGALALDNPAGRTPSALQHAPTPRGDGFLSSPRGRLLAALLAALGGWLMLNGALGLVVALVTGIGVWFGSGRLEPRARAREREEIIALLPVAADLLTAALAAGCPPIRAAEHVGHALGGPLGRLLVTAATTAAMGCEPAYAWSRLMAEPALRPLARALTSASMRGVSPVPVLEHIARDARQTARWEVERRIKSLGSRAAAPLGLCFLPAFVLVGIVPVVATSGLALW
ncbi:type II secretion system F family protein [Actinobacteria bacterium YIM 96077]|uniref:Type II secretion system F family protein n=1 Tax=Phytoactinopolyspora halophila TaxID=1981511 RepID=A0A329QZY4_9ACTN|nr:type II secretion system F family protein [Phytoactinopolyspora halophila]AYY11747.1 type II secretion system F family protein [Actinobacteria bacterium YIM 96077]RAW17817.1 type II secretion system F family protein [Phytoactinopolyspora halophila]